MSGIPVPEAAPVRMQPPVIETEKAKKPVLNSDIKSLMTPTPAEKKLPESPEKGEKNTKQPTYTMQTSLDDVRAALILDGLKQGKNKDFVIKNVDETVGPAKNDTTVMKGLIQYLNWQDKPAFHMNEEQMR